MASKMSGQPTLRFRFFSEASDLAPQSPDRQPPVERLESARKTWWEARRRLNELEARAPVAQASVFENPSDTEQDAEVEQSDAA